MSTPEPGYHGYRPASAATIAQILSGNGYCTAAVGKWHQTPPVEVSPSGPFPRWPMGEGFDFFYGFMGAEMNHWYPQLYQGRYPVEPDRLPEDGYHLSEDLVDNAIAWVENQQAITPERPFFTYVALGATHAPFHVAPEWRDKYAGRFDAGWDAQREQTLARQKELGIVPESAELAPWAEGVPHWDELDETEKRVAARFMETYAGFAEHADVQVGRFVDALDEIGVLDDTLFFYLLGDNGASGEGGPRGTFREHLVGHGIQDDTADMAARLDTLGDPTTYAIYPVGWALAMNTPYPWTKQVAHLGGTRDGMIVRWGNGIAARGEVRHQWHHVIDVLPTILEAAGLPAPETFGGVAQQPVEGTSLRYTFDAPDAAGPAHHAVLRDDRQPRGLPRGLDGRDPPRRPLGDGGHARSAPSTRTSGSSTTTPTTGARPATSPSSTPSGCASCRRSSSARPRSTTSSRSTTGSPSARTRRWPAGSTCTSAGPRCPSDLGSAGSPRRPRPTSRTART